MKINKISNISIMHLGKKKTLKSNANLIKQNISEHASHSGVREKVQKYTKKMLNFLLEFLDTL